MHSSAQCAHCEGTGTCPECNGTGINPHFNSADPKCLHCYDISGKCPECDGTGQSSIAMPLYQGSLLGQGLFWAAVVIAIFLVTSTFSNTRLYAVVLSILWTVSWCLILYRNAKRHEKRHESTGVQQ